MPLDIVITKENFTEVRARIRAQVEALHQAKTPLAKITVAMQAGVLKNFREQSADKKPWKKFAASTLYAKAHRKRRRSIAPMLLQDTGHLRQSIYPEVQGDTAVVSTNVPYAKFHQFGSEDKKHPPQRKFLLITKDAKQRIMAIARAWAFNKKGSEANG